MAMSAVLDRLSARATRKKAPRRTRAWITGAAAVLVGTALLAASGALYGRWIVDDAGITFDFARNIAAGYGPVAQPGGPVVEGYSDPTWLLVLLAGHAVGLFDRGAWFGVSDYVLFPKGVALLCCAGILVLMWRAFRRNARHAWLPTVIAAVALACIASFVIWTFSGLENALYALLVTGLAVRLLTASVRGTLHRPTAAAAAGVLAFAAALTRPDGLIYVAAFPLLVLLGWRRNQWRPALSAIVTSLVAFGVPYGVFLLVRHAVFGRWVPLTAVAKGQSIPSIAELGKVGDLVSYTGWLTVAVAVVVVGAGLAAGPVARRVLAGPLVTLLCALGAFAVLQGDWMPWYRFATPVWPLAVLVMLLAVPHAAATLRRRGTTVAAVLLAAGLVGTASQQYAVASEFRAEPTTSLCAVATNSGWSYNGMAQLLGKRDASLLTPDLGGSSLTSSLRLADLAGLLSPTFAAYWAHGDMPGLRDYVFDRLRPTFMHVSSGWAAKTGLLTDPRIRRDYAPLDEHGYETGEFVRTVNLSPTQLGKLRAYQRHTVQPARDRLAPRQSCGPLTPGRALPAHH